MTGLVVLIELFVNYHMTGMAFICCHQSIVSIVVREFPWSSHLQLLPLTVKISAKAHSWCAVANYTLVHQMIL